MATKYSFCLDWFGSILPQDKCQSRATWTITNFFSGPLDINKEYESREFEINFLTRPKWRLALKHRLRGVNENYSTVILLKRSYSCNAILPHNMRIKMEILDSPESNGFDGEFPSTVRHVELVDNEIYDKLMRHKTTLAKSNKLKIKCEFLFNIAAHIQETTVDEDLRLLSNNLRELWNGGDFRDLYLNVKGGGIAVNSAIVRARCPYIDEELRKNPDLRQIDLTMPNFNLSMAQTEGLIAYWYSGDFRDFFRISWTWSVLDKSLEVVKEKDIKLYYEATRIELTTTLVQCRRFVDWTIECSEICKEIKEGIESYNNHEWSFDQLPWKLRFGTKRIPGERQKDVHFSVLEEGIKCLHPVRLEAYLIDDKGNDYGVQTNVPWSRGNSPWKYYFCNFMSRDELDKLKRNLLECGTFRLECLIHYGTGIEKNDIETGSKMVQHPFNVLSSKMKKLFESGENGDITLIAGGKSFSVHMAVLAARSRYFPREFFGQRPGVFTVEHVGPDDLEMILKYMYYAEKIELNPELALRLYPAVRAYEINRLDDLCSEFLRNHATVGNALSIFENAHNFNDDLLKNAALFIIRRHWDLISTSRAWRLLPPPVASEIEERLIPRNVHFN